MNCFSFRCCYARFASLLRVIGVGDDGGNGDNVGWLALAVGCWLLCWRWCLLMMAISLVLNDAAVIALSCGCFKCCVVGIVATLTAQPAAVTAATNNVCGNKTTTNDARPFASYLYYNFSFDFFSSYFFLLLLQMLKAIHFCACVRVCACVCVFVAAKVN
ncbi:unnamed protein product [Ceratitis capitata]|uniref:(Mediterranean fruit fly) hypothetical protein n=1 Tax=Ceratitis capitata TaxID=7213 RepID=A0A811UMY2_CERCA|nr:unnamed protein product [Ceratitis capitata]